MTDQWYRIDDPDAYWPPVQKLIDNGTLVPVEIDYEAAIAEVKKYPTPPFGQSVGWGASIEDVVNAALGIEGGDDDR